MDISPERFKEVVLAATADRHKVVKAAVTGFGFVLTLRSRRTSYPVNARFDPATGKWSGYDPYDGNTLRFVIEEVERRLRESS